MPTRKRAGFKDRGGMGSRRNDVHPALSKPVTISGKLGDDAKQYQVRAVRRAISEVTKQLVMSLAKEKSKGHATLLRR